MGLIELVSEALDDPTQPAAALALAYAERIDSGGPDELHRFGPRLLIALDALLLTPKAVKAVTGRTPDPVQPAEPEQPDGVPTLDELRDRRGTRAARAAD